MGAKIEEKLIAIYLFDVFVLVGVKNNFYLVLVCNFFKKNIMHFIYIFSTLVGATISYVASPLHS